MKLYNAIMSLISLQKTLIILIARILIASKARDITERIRVKLLAVVYPKNVFQFDKLKIKASIQSCYQLILV